ncbi:MAG: sugar phosphate nucleotidyltransferase [Spirochaetia bacterium]
MKLSPTTIVLCGGKGTRMNSPTLHKVCFEIGGKPAIHRTLYSLMEAGLSDFIVVLGSMAGQVMECVGSAFDGIAFAYQKTPLGTGDAARTGVELIKDHADDDPVLVVMGDKIVNPGIITRMMEQFTREDADAVFSVQPKEDYPKGGRVVLDSAGGVIGIVEVRDVENAKESGKQITIGAETYAPETVESSPIVNAAVYLFKRDVIIRLLDRLKTDNAQGEFYLTDVIEMIAEEGGTVKTVTIEREEDILSFNTVEELLQVEEVILGKTAAKAVYSPRKWKTPSEWIRTIQSGSPEVTNQFEDIYGEDTGLIAVKKNDYRQILQAFSAKYPGDRKVIITRAPGRVNLMGRHVEHRGGWVNVISINKEIICVAAPREDDTVRISNMDSSFPDEEFRIGEHFKSMDWQNWLSYLDAKETQEMVLNAKGNWVNYVKAAVLRLQYKARDRKLNGMDMLFRGDIPMAAGLSSSSAVVVATAEAAIEANNLELEPQDFVDLCGEGEWFVGSRGGSGDHAAMKFGNRGNIAHLGFFPFRFEGLIPFPEGCKLVIANSFVKANKMTNAKDLFNQRIASYEFAFFLFLEKHPELKETVKYLRDINPVILKTTPSKLYRMILEIPEYAALEEIRRALPDEYTGRINRIVASHTVPDVYPLRAVLLYGVAECKRSMDAKKILDSGDVAGFGKLMNISHDGDRVVSYFDGNEQPFDYAYPDGRVQKLIAGLASEDPEQVLNAQVERQGGGYACSVPETDLIVDTALSVEGVLGAQLSGAGLGGCVMVLVREESVEKLTAELNRKYYEPRGLDSGITVCIPVKGSMVLES